LAPLFFIVLASDMPLKHSQLHLTYFLVQSLILVNTTLSTKYDNLLINYFFYNVMSSVAYKIDGTRIKYL